MRRLLVMLGSKGQGVYKNTVELVTLKSGLIRGSVTTIFRPPRRRWMLTPHTRLDPCFTRWVRLIMSRRLPRYTAAGAPVSAGSFFVWLPRRLRMTPPPPITIAAATPQTRTNTVFAFTFTFRSSVADVARTRLHVTQNTFNCSVQIMTASD